MKKINIKSELSSFILNNGNKGTLLNAEEDVLAPLCIRHFPERKRSLVIMTPSAAMAEDLSRSIGIWQEFLGTGYQVSLLPDTGGDNKFILQNEAERSRILFEARSSAAGIFLASIEACFSPTIGTEEFINDFFILKKGDSFPFKALAERLSSIGYDNEYQVSAPGEFSVRGGIIDIFSPVERHPARIEFWGDEIDNIRLFSTDTQRTTLAVAGYRISARSPVGDINSEHTFFSYFTNQPEIIFIYPEKSKLYAEKFLSDSQKKKFGEFILDTANDQRDVIFFKDSVESAPGGIDGNESYLAPVSLELPDYGRQELDRSGKDLYARLVSGQMEAWRGEGFRTSILCGGTSSSAHIREWLVSNLGDRHGITIETGKIPAGLVIPGLKLAILTEREIFYAPHKHKPGSRRPPEKTVRKDVLSETDLIAELGEGDHVVHLMHGVGIFHGIREITVGEGCREVFQIEFDNDVMVYVPVWQAYLISRYVGAKKSIPKLNKIGDSRWDRLKEQAARAARTFAAEMLRIHAMRAVCTGHSFPEDGAEQAGFEQAFPYQETADQLKASDEVKRDLVNDRPMDRLICGDVGYGKTEVAMRAAFKVVMSGKQVAVMAPTTILAQQHYYNFIERFSEYPVIIEMLSRFKTKHEQRKIVSALKEGKVDIVIGTHRLAQPDIEFPSLGLVVIDEEQRFGVAQKEKLKKMRAMVDILTMTATPIPRTLYLSMAGIKDLSTIMTPPGDRLPVETVICKFEPDIVISAILREVQRGGQVFFVHNRVKTIDKRAEILRKMLPDVRLGVAHGQMPEHELEDVMSLFIDGEIDVLVCTTIIESGVDIQNANTIIIERADYFGLAELYQLRGRVGRSSRQAYAYFMLPDESIVSSVARERLGAIRRYTHLGAGFKLAMKDLEIRGAGNILGVQQSGHINAVGFELYCQLLKSAVADLKGNRNFNIFSDVDIFIDFIDFGLKSRNGRVAAGLPKEYIPSERLRVDIYRRLSFAASVKEIDDIRDELKDRFGKIPSETTWFLKIMKLRAIAGMKKYTSLKVREGHIFIEDGRGRCFQVNGKIPEIKGSSPVEKFECLRNIVENLL